MREVINRTKVKMYNFSNNLKIITSNYVPNQSTLRKTKLNKTQKTRNIQAQRGHDCVTKLKCPGIVLM